MNRLSHEDGLAASMLPRRPIPAEPVCEWCDDEREVRNAIGNVIPCGWCAGWAYYDADGAA